MTCPEHGRGKVYTAEMIQSMPAGPELRMLAAKAAGIEVVQGRDGTVIKVGPYGRNECYWRPDEDWRDTGRLLDEAVHLSVDYVLRDRFWDALRACADWDGIMAWPYVLACLATSPGLTLAITRAFVCARLPEINKALEEEGT